MKKDRIIIPDIIRILCTAMILFHHYQQLTGTYFYKGINFWGGKFYFGNLVEVFFLMSGFFMVSYVKKITKNMSFGEFMTGRLIRLLPSMIVSTILYDIFLYIFVEFTGGQIRYPMKISWFGSIITALGLGSWHITKDYEINAVGWYVSVLILCYIIMYILSFISKKTKIPAPVLFAIPMILGTVRTYGMEYSLLPFFTTRIARGYIHFFGGIILGFIITSLFALKNKEKKTETQDKNVLSVLKKVINSVGEATLDIYLLQLPVLLAFFILSSKFGIKLVSGKTMLVYACVTFAVGYLYYFFIGKRIYSILKIASGKMFKRSKKAEN